MDRKRPFCIDLGQNLIIALFNDEIAELQDYAMDAGDALWYIMGTDAWLELQTETGRSALVARNYGKTYFTCFISNDIVEKIKIFHESTILVFSSDKELRPEHLLEDLNEDSSLDDVGYWVEQMRENKGVNIEAFIFCYYTTDARKRLHGDDFVD
jgi:hypothetical protein